MLQIEGRNSVIEYLKSETQKLSTVYIQMNIQVDAKLKELIDYAKQSQVQIVEVPKSKLDKMSSTGVHQGVIGVLAKYTFFKLEEMLTNIRNSNRDPFIIVVRESMYDHNLGAILRTASCVGANGIIISKQSEISPHVVRSSTGATAELPICRLDIFSSMKLLSDEGIKIVGIDIFDDSKWYYEADLKGAIALIIGGEDHPLTPSIASKCDFTVKIPLLSKINSLNMSVAAGIVMYEKLRQELV